MNCTFVGAWNERLGIAKDFVVFLRRDVAIVQSGNDCFLNGLECKLVAVLGMNGLAFLEL